MWAEGSQEVSPPSGRKRQQRENETKKGEKGWVRKTRGKGIRGGERQIERGERESPGASASGEENSRRWRRTTASGVRREGKRGIAIGAVLFFL